MTRIAKIFAVLALPFLLGGCLLSKTTIEIDEDGLISGEMISAVDFEKFKEIAIEMSEADDASSEEIEEIEDLDESELIDSLMEDLESTAEEVDPEDGTIEVAEYNEDGFVGAVATFEDLTIDEWNALSSSDEDDTALLIEEDGDEFVVTGTIDFSEEEIFGDDVDPDQIDDAQDIMQDAFESAEITYELTFPGEVTSVEGGFESDGCTATFEPDVAQLVEEGEVVDIEIVANNSGGCGSSSSSTMIIIGGAAGGFVLLLIIILLIVMLIRRKKKRGASTPPPAPVGGYANVPAPQPAPAPAPAAPAPAAPPVAPPAAPSTPAPAQEAPEAKPAEGTATDPTQQWPTNEPPAGDTPQA